MLAALATAAMGGIQAADIAAEGLRRAVAALDDLDTVAMLEKSLWPTLYDHYQPQR